MSSLSPRLSSLTTRTRKRSLLSLAKQKPTPSPLNVCRTRLRSPARQRRSANKSTQQPRDDMNPYAPPFSPVAGPHDYDDQPNPNQQLSLNSATPPWRANNAPPQPYPGGPQYYATTQQPYFNQQAYSNQQTHPNQQAYSNHAVQAYYQQWAQYYAYIGYPSQNLSYHGAPSAPMQEGQPSYSYPTVANQYTHAHSQVNFLQGTTNGELQHTFDSLIQRLRTKNRTANRATRLSDLEHNDSIQSVDAHGPAKQKKMGKEEKQDEVSGEAKTMTAKERRKDPKIFLPAPPPAPSYLSQAAEEPSTLNAPGQILVILDLNGTLIYRPNRNAKSMIARPFLKPFLRYLFSNFNVMVWSSARPHNVDSLVGQCLDKELRSKLVAEWARDSFSLSPEHYNLNVQVYKNLDLVWNSDIQQKHPDHAAGQRFGQHNTVLIDDSSLKANAQPHNLLEVTEFKATQIDAQQDVLREVAGYLEVLRTQADVSKFIHKDPFKFDGRWRYDWPAETPEAQGGELESKVSLNTDESESTNKMSATSADAKD